MTLHPSRSHSHTNKMSMIQTKNHGNKNKKYNKSEQFKLQKFTPELVV